MTEYEFVPGRLSEVEQHSRLSAWEACRNHREIVTGLIHSAAAPDAGSLCVLGAGHCRDIDLNQLLSRFTSIVLVDIKESIMIDGLRNQNVEAAGGIELVGGLDISGTTDSLEGFRSQTETASLVDILNVAASFSPSRLKTCDVVASTCLLSQLLYHASQCVDERNPEFVNTLQTIRLRHIEIMIELTRPGGAGLLITDFVSSESLPELFQTRDLKTTVKRAVSKNNFLHGLNPGIVKGVFEQPHVQTQLQAIKVTDPWRWVTPDRIYACFAIIFRKK